MRPSAAFALLLLAPSLVVAQEAEEPAGDDTPAEAVDVEEAEEVPPPPPAEPIDRVAVLVVAASEQEREAADGLTEVLIGAVALHGVGNIVGKEEVQSLLQQVEERTLECVTSPACLGRVGVQLGVSQAIVGTLSRSGSQWTFNLDRLDVRTGDVLGRVFREIEGEVGDVARTILDAAAELYAPPVQTVRLRIAANVPATLYIDDRDVGRYTDQPIVLEDLEPGPHQLRAEPTGEGYLPWSRTVELEPGADLLLEASLDRIPVTEPVPIPVPPEGGISSLVWVGGAVALAGAIGATGFGVSSQRSLGGDPNRAEAVAFVDDRERDALLANLAFGVVAIGVVTAVVGVLLSDFHRARIRPTAAVGRRGATLGFEGAL